MDNRETMASYDTNTLTISSMNVAQHDILRLTAPDNTSSSASGSLDLNLASMDAFDHDLGFEGDLLDPTLPFTPSYELSDAFSATFEDPFSYTTEPFSHHPNDPTTSTSQPTNPTDAPSLDNKLLGFSTPLLHSTLLTSSSTQAWPSMTAELYGMFFVAEDVFGSSPATNRPMELTCYRRNLFQISGNITLSRDITHVINEAGQSVPVYELLVSISAVESIEGKSTEIISVPWKTSTVSGGIGNSEEKSGALPPKWPLDLSLNPELDPSCVSLPLAWKRLQFKHATANNGRRKGLQQHYVIQINLLAMTGAGEVKVAEMRSGAIIVRGRSPRNFDGRRDVPLSEKREPKGRTSSDAAPPPMKVDPAVTSSSYRFYALNQLQQPLDLPDWSSQSQSQPLPSPTTDSPHRPFKKPLQSLPSQPSQTPTQTPTRPPIPKTKWSSTPSLSSSSSTSQKIASTPIDLSLTDEEYRGVGTGRGSPEVERQKRGGAGGGGGGGGKVGASGGGLGSPVENLELLYEYFPLSLDDWMPPVDAIYRPHVVHHTWPPDFKAQQVTNKTKRYFSADD